MTPKTVTAGPLRVEVLPEGRRVRVVEPFRVEIANGTRRVVEVPVGFVTDFASVPRLFWRLTPPWGRYSLAAVVHDYLYCSGIVSRREADDTFLTLMQAAGVPAWESRLIYWAVRRFGGWAWRRARKQDADK